jgi:predicted MFS family arabinose efflux permease
MGLIMGLLTAGHQIGASIGASFGGLMFDQYGDYNGVWLSSLLFAGLAAVIALGLNLKAKTSHRVE